MDCATVSVLSFTVWIDTRMLCLYQSVIHLAQTQHTTTDLRCLSCALLQGTLLYIQFSTVKCIRCTRYTLLWYFGKSQHKRVVLSASTCLGHTVSWTVSDTPPPAICTIEWQVELQTIQTLQWCWDTHQPLAGVWQVMMSAVVAQVFDRPCFWQSVNVQ